MIVRIRRARYHVKDETDLFREMSTLIEGRPRPSGLLDLLVARQRLDDGRMEQTVISLWDSRRAIAEGLTPAWDVPPQPTACDAAVEGMVEHLEIEADDWPEFLAMVKARSRPLS